MPPLETDFAPWTYFTFVDTRVGQIIEVLGSPDTKSLPMNFSLTLVYWA
jgi:hypothetical protein